MAFISVLLQIFWQMFYWNVSGVVLYHMKFVQIAILIGDHGNRKAKFSGEKHSKIFSEAIWQLGTTANRDILFQSKYNISTEILYPNRNIDLLCRSKYASYNYRSIEISIIMIYPDPHIICQ